jgi:hypothetical protein
MALSTYSELKSAIETWLARQGDTNISSNAADFVTLAEARLNRDLPLRVMHTTTTLTGTISSRAVALPSDFIEPIALFLTTFGEEEMLKPLVAGNFEYRTTSGTPVAWCINGTNIDLDAPCDQAHTFSFRYRKSFALSDAAPTNWLLTNHPDCYLSACMVEAGIFAEDERASSWEQRLRSAIDSIAWVDARSISVGTLSVDPALRAPGRFDFATGRTWP